MRQVCSLLFFTFILQGCYIGLDNELGSKQYNAPSILVGDWRAIDGDEEFTIDVDESNVSKLLFSDDTFNLIPLSFYNYKGEEFIVVLSSTLLKADEDVHAFNDFFIYFNYILKDQKLYLRRFNYDVLADGSFVTNSRFSCHVHEEINIDEENCTLNECIVLDVDEVKMDLMFKTNKESLFENYEVFTKRSNKG